MNAQEKKDDYQLIIERIFALIEGETDQVAIFSTIVCELHQSIDYFHWTGFYRVTQPELLTVGPYQGGHGCLRIPFSKGICGQSARLKSTIIIDDVNLHSDHIACSTSTRSEIVVPVTDAEGQVRAVLDIDSDIPSAFDKIDGQYLEQICERISQILYS